ncbi:putative glycosyltransferase [Gordonia rubripertincta NBRC 101908]|uniref:Glycosyltransferase n=1 Tax=Gordonia rubripertincta NBRC 101908 TaxID=1077975 RepID=A0ABQ0HPN9_GORRU|nr:putative glycosyltransferase [Gordonia rubripertincta NBRC 101908]
MLSSAKIHVVHVTEAFGGGIQTAIAQYVQNSPWAKHTIIARARSGHDVGELDQFSNVSFVSAGDSVAQFLANAPELVNNVRADVIHLHSSIAGALRLHPKLRCRKVIYTPHCYSFERLDQPRLRRLLYRWFERICGYIPHVVAGVSEYEVAVARRISSNARVELLPNVMPSSENVAGLLRDDETRTVATVGRICAQKGPEIFAEGYLAFKRSGGPSDVSWIWVGDGDPELRALLETAGVLVLGWQSNADVRAILRRSSLYVHTARWEGAPIAPLEASVHGVPVMMQRTRTTGSLGYLTFDSALELGGIAARYFLDEAYKGEVSVFEAERRADMDCGAQTAALSRLYAEVTV